MKDGSFQIDLHSSHSDNQYSSLQQICMDKKGSIYIAEYEKSFILKISPDNTSSVIHVEPGKHWSYGADNGQGHSFGVAVDEQSGDIYVSSILHQIYRINSNGTLHHFSKSTVPGYVDGPIESAKFSTPAFLAFLDSDTILCGDTQNHAIRAISIKSKKSILLTLTSFI